MLLVLFCFMLLFGWVTLVFAEDEEFPWILFYPAITGTAHVKVPSWGAIETITNVGPVAYFDSLMDSKGNVTVVWKYISSTNEYVLFLNKRFDVGSGWSPIEKIETLTVGMADSIYHSGPKLITDHMGNINMVWATKTSPLSNRPDKFWARRYTKVNGWEEKEPLHSSTNNSPFNCLEDLNGNISVCTSQYTAIGFAEEGYIFYKIGNRWRLGGASWPSRTLYYFEYPKPLPSFIDNFGFVDEFGNFILYETNNTNSTLYVSHYSINSDSMNREVVHNRISSKISDIHIVRDIAGDATIVWRDFDGSKYNLWANHYTAGVGWDTAEIIIDDNQTRDVLASTYSDNLHVVVDHFGNVTAIWVQGYDGRTGSNRNLWTNRYLKGTGWGQAELIEERSWDALDPMMAMDTQDNITVVWGQYSGQYNRLWSKRHSASGGWGPVQEIPTGFTRRIPKELIVDNLDNVTLIFRYAGDSMDDPTGLSSIRYSVGSGWGGAGGISCCFKDDLNIQAVLDGTNNITLFMLDRSYYYGSPVGSQLTSARSTEEGGWYLQESISPWAFYKPGPHAMVDSVGNITVVFGEMLFPESISMIRTIQLTYQ
jgi:hypothetical protein